ncbi:ATP-binding protein [Methylobacterium sp. J-090]|uniref:ATP-binding protein n=1 Tax=Methylobacterium sp. J-090 TaxID=2836666 RepID=UPI001FBB8A2B|nr:ATP-binding protein [Methylobacterium sp. J-090]MCJ2083540.1 ATP-binding protein [Methylobacterium sp. J-090]
MTSKPSNEAERLVALRALDLVGSLPEPHFDAVCRTAQALFDMPICLVTLVEEQEQWFKAKCGLEIEGTSREVSFCSHAILSDAIMVIEDAKQDIRFSANPLVTGPPYIRFYAGAPLTLQPGIRVGTLCLIDTKSRALTAAQAHQLEDLARIVVAHLRLHEALRTGEAAAEQHALDVTARRQAEQVAAESEARLHDAVELAHNAILAQLAEGVIVTDTAGRITLVNEAAAAIHGVARLDVDPEDYSETYHLYMEDGTPYIPENLPLTRAVRGETVRDARWRVRRPDGIEVLAIGSARPLVGRDGDRVGAVLTMRDDTARDAAERALRESEAELRELNATLSERVAAQTRDAEAARLDAEHASAAKTEFLAAMSHEIRTPLNAIIGFTDLMLGSGRMQPDLQRQAELVRTSGAALLTVVNDILDFSKVEAGAIALERQAFAPRTLIDNCLSIVRGSGELKGLDIRSMIDPAVPRTLFGDEARLRQMLLNLLNNAIKFTGHGSVILSVRHAGTDQEGERLHFSVTDTGIGIARDKQDRLFQRFSQVDGSIERRFGGTGLGLAICRQLIELMRGRIGVFSEEGVGATFWFSLTLPLGTAGQPLALDKNPPRPLRSGRLLVVEDHPINQELARAALEAGGHTVEVVSDGASAIRAVERTRFDLVLMDVQMAGMDGLTTARHIRKLGTSAATMPIVAMTANVLPEQIRLFHEAGMDDHIGKPFNRVHLYQVIDRWLSCETAALPSSLSADRYSLLDQSTYDGIVATIGSARTAGIIDALVEELGTYFLGEAATVDERIRLRFEAHTCISSAGTLGFVALSAACRALESHNEQRVADEGLETFQRLLHETRVLARQTATYAARLLH